MTETISVMSIPTTIFENMQAALQASGIWLELLIEEIGADPAETNISLNHKGSTEKLVELNLAECIENIKKSVEWCNKISPLTTDKQ